MTCRSWTFRALCALAMGVAGCGAGEPIHRPAHVPVDLVPPGSAGQAAGEQVHVYIAHGREITETLRVLQKEIDEERSRSGEPAVMVQRDRATTMNIEEARRRIANGSLHLRWVIPEEATIKSGIVWSAPLTPRK